MNHKEHIVNLIAKQLQGLATPPETEELQQWLQSDPACQQEYDEMKLIWQNSGPLLADPAFNADVAWLQLDDRIGSLTGRQKTPFHKLISFFSTPVKAAATILVLVLIGLGGYWWHWQAQWQTVAATDKNTVITLPDHSVVTVRKGSSIKYLKVFDKKERRVKLTGEAFFTVQHNEHQPFFVNAGNSEVKVLGTSFLVNSQKTVDKVTVITGKVNVTRKSFGNDQITLTKGEEGTLTPDHTLKMPLVLNNFNFIAWATGQLVFENTALPEVLHDIAANYGVALELAPGLSPQVATTLITVHFNNQPIEQVLEEIRLITGLQMKKEKDKIIFYRN
jgi:ferric-dicitrate binding protein FerR (iron transport regulator)